MGLLVCSVLIPGKLEEVFHFHTDPKNLSRVQPPGMKPSKIDFPQPLRVGSECLLWVPTLLGQQQWKIRIEKFFCNPGQGRALMMDRALESPFSFWLHRHCFEDENGSTRMTDVVDFELPFGIVGKMATPFAWVFLRFLFAVRHVRTARLFRERGGRS